MQCFFLCSSICTLSLTSSTLNFDYIFKIIKRSNGTQAHANKHEHIRTSFVISSFFSKKIKCQKDANTHTHMHAGNEIVVESHISSNYRKVQKEPEKPSNFEVFKRKCQSSLTELECVCVRACVCVYDFCIWLRIGFFLTLADHLLLLGSALHCKSKGVSSDWSVHVFNYFIAMGKNWSTYAKCRYRFASYSIMFYVNL